MNAYIRLRTHHDITDFSNNKKPLAGIIFYAANSLRNGAIFSYNTVLPNTIATWITINANGPLSSFARCGYGSMTSGALTNMIGTATPTKLGPKPANTKPNVPSEPSMFSKT
jgi:hypothetical protein